LLGAAALALCSAASASNDVPASGGRVPGFEVLERVVLEHRARIGARAVTVAVGRGDALVYARGFGWADRARSRPVAPDARMRIASATKPITAAAAEKLIAEGRLHADETVLRRLGYGIDPADARWWLVTVRHLIEHRGGWDARERHDALFRVDAIARRLRLDREPQAEDIVRYMLREPLQYRPGTRKVYSNFGYCVLGRVIERAAGLRSVDYGRAALLAPLGIEDVDLARNGARAAREVEYPANASRFDTETGDSAGGLIASAPALVRFLEHYWLSGAPRRAGERGSWTVFGSLPGTSAMMRQLPSGVNYAVLMNARREASHRADQQRLARAMDAALERVDR
ncbi:MAG: serine hydrolase domain-containing protein, partial [Burkholderiales bacterium]|nr:serine hydrolase domain-containing protein [Burkholderiales bacterium]